MDTTITTSVELITPATARKWLASNTHNRSVKHGSVERLTRIIRAGLFEMNGESIVFADDGRLMNGQHRLMACVEANVPITSVVVRGVRFTAIETMDAGVRRTLADQLTMRGEKHSRVIGSIITQYAKWSRYPNQFFSITTPEALAFFDRNDELRDIARIAESARKSAADVRSGMIGAVAFQALRGCGDVDLVAEWCANVSSGSAPKGDPTFTLWKTLVNWKQQRHVSRGPAQHIAVLVKCWNDTVLGNAPKLYRQRSDEAFPVLVDLDGNPVAFAEVVTSHAA